MASLGSESSLVRYRDNVYEWRLEKLIQWLWLGWAIAVAGVISR